MMVKLRNLSVHLFFWGGEDVRKEGGRKKEKKIKIILIIFREVRRYFINNTNKELYFPPWIYSTLLPDGIHLGDLFSSSFAASYDMWLSYIPFNSRGSNVYNYILYFLFPFPCGCGCDPALTM